MASPSTPKNKPIKDMSCRELQSSCKKKGIQATGKAVVLQRRLLAVERTMPSNMLSFNSNVMSQAFIDKVRARFSKTLAKVKVPQLPPPFLSPCKKVQSSSSKRPLEDDSSSNNSQTTKKRKLPPFLVQLVSEAEEQAKTRGDVEHVVESQGTGTGEIKKRSNKIIRPRPQWLTELKSQFSFTQEASQQIDGDNVSTGSSEYEEITVYSSEYEEITVHDDDDNNSEYTYVEVEEVSQQEGSVVIEGLSLIEG